eukprot:5082156-Prymnesium_polylepis.1
MSHVGAEAERAERGVDGEEEVGGDVAAERTCTCGGHGGRRVGGERRRERGYGAQQRRSARRHQRGQGEDGAGTPPATAPIPRRATSEHEGDDESE